MLWEGWRVVWRHPRLRWLSLLPALMVLIAPVVLAVFFFYNIPLPAQTTLIGRMVLGFLRVLSLGMGVLGGMGLAYGLSGPVLQSVCETVAEQLGMAAQPPQPFWQSMALASVLAFVGMLIALMGEGLLALIDVLLPPLALLTLPLGALLAGMMVLWSIFDIPMRHQQMGPQARLAFFRTHFRACLGFSAALAILLFLPILDLFFLPAAVAGATLLLQKIRAGHTHR